MSRIYISGDTHQDFRRFSSEHFLDGKELNKDDYVIICGDFGLLWDYKGWNKTEEYWRDWLDNKPWTTLFCDGNHSNFDRLNAYPTELWNGGRIHKITDSIIHLIRGEVFNINGDKFFVFGGGQSHDVEDGILNPNADDYEETKTKLMKNPYSHFRIEGISWWKEEMPSFTEMENGRHNLYDNENEVDYIISHEPDMESLVHLSFGTYTPNMISGYLADIKRICNYKRHYCGHLHLDMDINMTKTTLVYRDIIRIK